MGAYVYSRVDRGVRGAATALQLAESALERSTYKQYGRLFEAFVDYCASEHLEPLPADPFTVFSYIGHLAEEGRWQESSLQPILSAINRAHRDHGLEPPAAHNHFISAARAGMARAQVAVGTSDSRVPLPADVAIGVLELAEASPCAPLPELRESFSVMLAYLFAGRQDSAVALRSPDFGIDQAGRFFWLRLTEKGKRRLRVRRVVRLPLDQRPVHGHESALPRVAALAARYLASRVAACAEAGAAVPEFLLQLPGEARPTTPAMSRWLAAALARTGAEAPQGFAYLGHSLRAGAVSAMAAIGVPRHLYVWLGGWSPSSRTVDKHYIDPTVLPSPAAFELFGWALSRQFVSGDGVPEVFVPLPDPRDPAEEGGRRTPPPPPRRGARPRRLPGWRRFSPGQ